MDLHLGYTPGSPRESPLVKLKQTSWIGFKTFVSESLALTSGSAIEFGVRCVIEPQDPLFTMIKNIHVKDSTEHAKGQGPARGLLDEAGRGGAGNLRSRIILASLCPWGFLSWEKGEGLVWLVNLGKRATMLGPGVTCSHLGMQALQTPHPAPPQGPPEEEENQECPLEAGSSWGSEEGNAWLWRQAFQRSAPPTAARRRVGRGHPRDASAQRPREG